MNLNEIKDIIAKDGGKIIIVENDKPTMVVMSFEEYQRNPGQKNNPGLSVPQKPNLAWSKPSLAGSKPEAKVEQRQAPFMQEIRDEEPEELTIDDLPL